MANIMKATLAVQLQGLDLDIKRFEAEKAAAMGSPNARVYAPHLLEGFLPEEIDDGSSEPDVAPNGFIETDDLPDESSFDTEDRLIAALDGVTGHGGNDEEDFSESSFADVQVELETEEDGYEPDYLAVRSGDDEMAPVIVVNAIETEPVVAKRTAIPEIATKLDPKDAGFDGGPLKAGRREVLATVKTTEGGSQKKRNGRKRRNRHHNRPNEGGSINFRFPTLESLIKRREEKPKPVMVVCRRAPR